MTTRRALLHSLGGCALCLGSAASLAGTLQTDLAPVVTLGYSPLEADERGLWQSCEQLEEQIKVSNLRIRDPQINEYLMGVMHRLLGDPEAVRVYLVRNPEFNASMAPNGLMIVHTGLLARMRNEAQLAAVLGHESGHYLRRHSLQGWRSQRSKSAVMAFVAAGANAATGYTGQRSWYDLANAINSNLLLSIFSYSRTLESEADAYGLKLLTNAGYPPDSASQVWAQLIEERKASAAARKKKYKDGSASAYSTHPPTTDRMEDLGVTAKLLRMRRGNDSQYDDRRAAYLAAVGPYRADLLEEQIKLNDPGASLYLVNSLAQDGWDTTLRFFEGEVYRLRDEPGDAQRAMQAYSQAAGYPDASFDALRAHGYTQLKNGSREEGLAALRRYLDLNPDATDAQMVRFTLEQ